MLNDYIIIMSILTVDPLRSILDGERVRTVNLGRYAHANRYSYANETFAERSNTEKRKVFHRKEPTKRE